MGALLRLLRFRGLLMQAVTTIGLGIAKSVFQVHGVDAAGQMPMLARHGAMGAR